MALTSNDSIGAGATHAPHTRRGAASHTGATLQGARSRAPCYTDAVARSLQSHPEHPSTRAPGYAELAFLNGNG